MNREEELQTLTRALRQGLCAVEAGEELQPDEVNVLMRRIEAVVPDLAVGQVATLKQLLDRFIAAVCTRRDDVEAQLKQLRQGKKGLKGYSHIRSYGTQQRLSKTV